MDETANPPDVAGADLVAVPPESAGTELIEPEPDERREAADPALIDAHVAEYLALRSEIEWLIKDGSQYQGFAIALLLGAPALLQFVYGRAPELLLVGVLALPFPFCLLGFLFFRQHEEVYVVASYLAKSLRPRLRRLTGDERLWGWEEFKSRYTSSTGVVRASGKIVVVLRGALFLLPAGVSLAVAAPLLLIGPPYVPNSTVAHVLMPAAFVSGLALTFLLTAFLWTQSDFDRRILDLHDRSAAMVVRARRRPLLWFGFKRRLPGPGMVGVLRKGIGRLLLRGTDLDPLSREK